MMSSDEVRYWLTALRKEHGWGTHVLSRTLGFCRKDHACSKASGQSWLYRRERVRAARQIERILAGELICIPGKRGRGNIGRAVLAEHPKPLVGPMAFTYDLKRGRVRFVPRDRLPPLKLPGA